MSRLQDLSKNDLYMLDFLSKASNVCTYDTLVKAFQIVRHYTFKYSSITHGTFEIKQQQQHYVSTSKKAKAKLNRYALLLVIYL